MDKREREEDSSRVESAEGKLGRWRGKFTATSIKTVNFPGRHVISGGVLSTRYRSVSPASVTIHHARPDNVGAPRQLEEGWENGATCAPGCVLEEVCVRISGRSLTSITRATVCAHLYQGHPRFPRPDKALDSEALDLPVSSPVSSSSSIFAQLAPSGDLFDLRPAHRRFQRHNRAVSHQRIDSSHLSITVSSRFIVNNPNVCIYVCKLVYAAWELCCFASSPLVG